MAAIAVNERLVKLARVDQSMVPAISGEPLDAGVVASQAADGRWFRGTAGENRAVIVETVLTANAPISPLKKGILDLGPDLQSRNPGIAVHAVPATGALDDVATGNVRIGYVEAGRGDVNGEGNPQRRYLRVDL